MQQIKAYLDQIATISNLDWSFFTSKLHRRVIEKKSIFLKVNEIENQISFIESGIVRLFIPKDNPEKEITFGFSLTYDDLQSVYKSTQIGNLIGRLTAEDLFLIKSNREQNLLNLTAEQRYLKLFKERPELLESIPLKYISSYIGVTAQALSRIRKRLIHTLY